MATDFLEWLRPGGPWVLVANPLDKEKHPGGTSTRTFTELHGLDGWLRSFEDGDFNFYVQVNPTKGPMSKKPGRKDIAALEFLHVDIDPRAGEDFAAERERIRTLLINNLPDCIPRPSAIIDSGNGYWGFWRLDEGMPIGGQEELYEQAKLYNLQLELLLGCSGRRRKGPDRGRLLGVHEGIGERHPGLDINSKTKFILKTQLLADLVRATVALRLSIDAYDRSIERLRLATTDASHQRAVLSLARSERRLCDAEHQAASALEAIENDRRRCDAA